ncbi:MAG: hypothetical protein ACFFDN_01295 [Candidatus Hodarchaeota archaeon]
MIIEKKNLMKAGWYTANTILLFYLFSKSAIFMLLQGIIFACSIYFINRFDLTDSNRPNMKFNKNWNNKLNNDVFTTIRKYDETKFQFYESMLNKEYNIVLDKDRIGKAKLIKIEIKEFIKIPTELLILDTGETSLSEIHKIFKDFEVRNLNEKMLLLWFKKV